MLQVKRIPPTATPPSSRTGFLVNEQIDVVFFDSQTEDEQSEEVNNTIVDHLRESYPGAIFQKLDDSEYFATPDSGKITLKINTAGYSAGFGVGPVSGIGLTDGEPYFSVVFLIDNGMCLPGSS